MNNALLVSKTKNKITTGDEEMFVEFRRVCESDEEASLQKRFKQDICPQEESPHIPTVLLKSDFCSIEKDYLSFPNDAQQNEEDLIQTREDSTDKADVIIEPVTPLEFEDMSLEQVGSPDPKQSKAAIKQSLLSSGSNFDGNLNFIRLINPESISSFDFNQEEPFCPQIPPTEILKCVLDVLQGEESFLFKFNKEINAFAIALVKDPFHDTQSTVTLLNEFATIGTKVKRLRDFTKRNILSFSDFQQVRQTPTMMSFSQSLDSILVSLKSKVLKIPTQIIKNRSLHRGEMFLESQLYTTLISPLEVLSVSRLEIFPEINSLYEFCSFVVEKEQGFQQTSAQVLSHMYIFLQRSGQLDRNGDLLKIFVNSVKPFCHTLRSFLTCGEAIDPCNEFFVEKSTFFDRGNSYVPIFINKYAKQIKEIGFMFSLLGLGRNDGNAYSCTYNDTTEPGVGYTDYEMCTDLMPSKKRCSFEEVIKDSQLDIGEIFDRPQLAVESMSKVMSMKPVSDPDEDNLDLTSVEDVVDTMFCKTIEENYIRTGAAAISVLNTKWHMREHIRAIKKYLLMEAGDFSGELCERIFSSHSEFTDYQWILEETDRECLWVDEYRKNLSFVVSDGERHPIDSIKYMNFLSLTYTIGDGKDPLTRILFTQENMKRYESMWRFLLRIKRALFLLREAWVTTKKVVPRSLLSSEEMRSENRIRKSRIVLSSMDRLLKDVEVYFYHEGLYGPWVTFVASLESASNVEALVRCHDAFLDEMLARCFLHKKFVSISRIFAALIDTAIKFTYVCEEDEAVWKPLDEKFRDTVRMLFEILSKVNEGKTRYDLSLAQLLHVLELLCPSM